MEELMVLVGNFGFPIVVTVFLLVRLEGKMESLSESIQKLSLVIEQFHS